MSTPIRLPEELVQKAKRQAQLDRRSTSSQIQHWAEIGKIAEDNSDLPYAFIRDMLISMQEIEHGEVEAYQFGEGKED